MVRGPHAASGLGLPFLQPCLISCCPFSLAWAFSSASDEAAGRRGLSGERRRCSRERARPEAGCLLGAVLGGEGKGAFPASVATFSVALVLSDPEQPEYWVTGIAYFNHSGQTSIFRGLEGGRQTPGFAACLLRASFSLPQSPTALPRNGSQSHAPT